MHCFALSRYLFICVHSLMCSLNLPQASPKLVSVNASQIIIRSIHPLHIPFPTKTCKMQPDYFFFPSFLSFLPCSGTGCMEGRCLLSKDKESSPQDVFMCLLQYQIQKIDYLSENHLFQHPVNFQIGSCVLYDIYSNVCDFSLSPVCLS